MITVQLRSKSWYGDHPLVLGFPESWDVTVVGPSLLAELTNDQITEQFDRPIGTLRLRELAQGKQRVSIIVDDVTRPTPAARLLPFVFHELEKASVAHHAVTIIVAGGTHPPSSDDDLRMKLGSAIPSGVRVIPHDSEQGCEYIGRSTRGTPLYVNRAILAADLKIGIGGIYPHPSAGFSGGSKIIMPASCGKETARYLHHYLRGGQGRVGVLASEFRDEVEEVATTVGLDCIVNVVLNQSRQVAAVFVGDRLAAHRVGAEWAKQMYTVNRVTETDIVIADMYPFDLDLQFAYSRGGLWPFEQVSQQASKVLLAACPRGIGGHSLYPLTNAVRARIFNRLRQLHWKDFRDPLYKIQTMMQLWKDKRAELLILAPELPPFQLRQAFPRARRYVTWLELLSNLERRHGSGQVRVAVYPCAPMLLPAPGP